MAVSLLVVVFCSSAGRRMVSWPAAGTSLTPAVRVAV